MSDTFDELRIIAKDMRGIPSPDRAVIERAADEYEELHRMLVGTQERLIETQQRLIAANERYIAIRVNALGLGPKLSMQLYSGPLIIKGWPTS